MLGSGRQLHAAEDGCARSARRSATSRSAPIGVAFDLHTGDTEE